ncbi:SepM family pheromone-processing serine protease [Anoxybacillus suryakundensis]|uniref:endopeptidase La n=1 Tax=Anoxybacillus suryakundensis TaxID=1325335 RepID=A0A0K6GK88_9BACL|nr:SepM family pheromone-processing serine protease [Anoxybacillus suryakundensis]CUA78936.1 Predicted secreted protein containing a PDZ domain [Anoxybacillus suryakundensis]
MKKKRYIGMTAMIALLLAFATFFHLPYYVTMPGTAEPLRPLVEVKDGYKEKGQFMLTTVRMGQANLFSFAFAHVSKYNELYRMDEVRQEGESDEEYTHRQLKMMENSKETAIAVAYKKANKSFSYRNKGVYVLYVVDGMPAANVLKSGDQIVAVDGQRINEADEFIQYVGQKKKGERVRVTYKRSGKEKTATLTLAPFPKEKHRVGLGLSVMTDRDIVTDPPVRIESDQIGGPSAGLMFTLEVYNQLVPQDLTKGYRIAGTGTINIDGEVGSIGGISQKVIAAHKAGADIFFAPNERGAKHSNYKEAVKTAKDIGTKMKIVPVDTLDDAIQFLQKLS